MKKHVKYVIEREFLSEISIEELIARIICSHWNDSANSESSV